MYSQRKAEMKKLKRREKQSQIRQALLINEYIQTKYFAIYQEAAYYYNELNARYPSRPDLRKADEFRAWKLAIKGEPVRVRKYSKARYTNIRIQSAETPVETPTETPSEMPIEIEMPVETPTETRSEMPIEIETPVETPTETPTETPSEMPIEIEMPVETPTETPTETPSEMPIEIKTPVEIPIESIPKKVMELKIQLMDPAIITQTLSVETDEIIQENPMEVAAQEIFDEEIPTLHSTLTEEIPQHIIEKIVKELQDAPELRNIMTDIEQELEFQQIDNEIDMFEDTRLEEELENLMW